MQARRASIAASIATKESQPNNSGNRVPEGGRSSVQNGRGDSVQGGRASVSGGRASVSGGRASVSAGRASVQGGGASVIGGRASVQGGRVSLHDPKASANSEPAAVEDNAVPSARKGRRQSIFERPNPEDRRISAFQPQKKEKTKTNVYVPDDADQHRRATLFNPHGQTSPVWFPDQKGALSEEFDASQTHLQPHHHHHQHHHHGRTMTMKASETMRRAGGFVKGDAFARMQGGSHLSIESDPYAISLRSPRRCIAALCRRFCRCFRRACSAARTALNAEAEEVWGKSRTAQRIEVCRQKLCGRRQCRHTLRRWWRKLLRRADAAGGVAVVQHGGGSSTHLRADDIQDHFHKHTSQGGFGVQCFIIHNPGELEAYYAMETKEIAVGGSAKIYKAVERATGVERAIKKISKSDSENVIWGVQEVELMKELDHPNIIKLFETFNDKKSLYLVMELCSGGDLLDRLVDTGPYTEFQSAVVIRTVLMTLNYMHANGYVHRDIKPENIMFKDSRHETLTSALRLVDLGFARKMPLESPFVSTKVGSPYYVAPEVIAGEYDERCDLWSCGVLAYVLLCGYPPFSGFNDAETLHLIKQGSWVFPRKHWQSITKPAKHLIKHLLQVDPDERLGMIDALGHPWVKARGAVRIERMRDETVDRLLTYNTYSSLRRAAMLAVAYQLEAHDVRELTELFQGLDLDGDGLLTVQEFVKGVEACGIDKNMIQRMMKSVDADNSGVIAFCEFLAATLDRSMYIKNHAALYRAFRSFDQDDSGGLSREEIAETLRMTQVEHLEEVQEFFEAVDINGDGVMDYKEFYVMLQKEVDPEMNEFQVETDLLPGTQTAEPEDDDTSDDETSDSGAQSPSMTRSPRSGGETARTGGETSRTGGETARTGRSGWAQRVAQDEASEAPTGRKGTKSTKGVSIVSRET